MAQDDNPFDKSLTRLPMLVRAESVERAEIVLKGIVKVDLLAFADVDQVPVDDVGELFVEDGAHRFAAEIGARVRRRLDEEVAFGQAGQPLLDERRAGQTGQK